MLITMPDGRRFRLEYGPGRTCRLWEVSGSGPTMLEPDPAVVGPDARGWWPIPEAIDFLCMTCGEWAILDDRCAGASACAACGESRLDALVWCETTAMVICQTCGCLYDPVANARAATA